jgi:ABC-type multidrug transport system fused ATPase/permease subunit
MGIPGLNDRRFDNRETRINRREERNLFRLKLMPVAWFLSAIGAAGLLILGAYYMLYGDWLHHFSGLFVALAILPFVLTLVGWLRGHSNPDLEEP